MPDFVVNEREGWTKQDLILIKVDLVAHFEVLAVAICEKCGRKSRKVDLVTRRSVVVYTQVSPVAWHALTSWTHPVSGLLRCRDVPSPCLSRCKDDVRKVQNT
jgi:hypothetical protein